MANLSAFGGAQPITPGGLVELGYGQITSTVVVSSTSFTTPTTIIPDVTVVCDGSPIMVEFYAPQTSISAGQSQLVFALWEDGAEKHRYWQLKVNPAGSTGVDYDGVKAETRLTPSAGTHTYRVVGISGPANNSVLAGSATTSNSPAFLRVSKIVQATQWPAVTTGTIICTSSTRPASPFEGQTIYETDTKKQLTYDGAGWYPPWNQPWGLVAKAELSANTSGITTGSDLATGDLTFTAVAGRAYRIYSQVLITIGVADAYFGLQIKEGSTIHTTGISTVIQNTGLATLYASRVMTFSAGSHSLKMHVYRQLGAGNAATAISPSNRPDYLMVEDIGPA